MNAAPPYAELAVTSNFSFLRGASHPDELVLTAAVLGYRAIGIADRNTLAGVVRAHSAAKQAGIQLLVGCRLVLQDGFETLCFPQDRAAYGRLTRLLTRGNRRAPKGECFLTLDDVLAHGEGQIFVVLPPLETDDAFERSLALLAEGFPGNVYLAATLLYRGDDKRRLAGLAALARHHGVPLAASNDVHFHIEERRILQDVVTCIREHCTIDEAGFRLHANAERHLKTPHEMQRLFAGYEDALQATADIAARCRFSLDELAYEYPDEIRGESATPQAELERLTWLGAAERYGDGISAKIRASLEHELKLIGELNYAPYFLTVHDIVRFARSRGILCQGRGSAANSAVCYCLGITSVDPAQIDLLFERFVSAERNEPPDIDVDFEHERREEVIQYIYETYGRHRAGLAATVISYRSRSAIREVGKVMGLSLDTVDALAGTIWGWSKDGIKDEHVAEAGLDPNDERLRLALDLTCDLIGFPRHLSQHVGGFVITRGPLDEVAPICNAAMEDRTIVEWDKDDLDALGILKIDVLALGMLTCIRKAFDLMAKHYERPLTLASIPPEDPRVYDMICRADTTGVFQIESRAQMSMLPRLKPRCFYDLVIEVAIVRPGPIQGDMVHPYLRRRNGEEPISYPKKELEDVLGKTMGVPLFQEQAMRIAIVAAGFTPAEADQLRRAMATFRKMGTIGLFQTKLIEGMVARGYARDFAERCFKQIEGFGEYGFPESHAASFALLVYVSAWLKCHYPEVFACALINSQPMGFYAPAQIVRDLREHGGEIRPVDINHSFWDCTLEADGAAEAATEEGGNSCALRLGFRQIKGFREDHARLIETARGAGFDSVRDLYFRTGLPASVLERLAHADAFRSLGLDRRDALWAVYGLGGSTGDRGLPEDLPLFARAKDETLQREAEVTLRPMPLGEHVVHDYASLRLSLKAHPLSFLRDVLRRRKVVTNDRLAHLPADREVRLAGLVLARQRPGTAKGVIFATLEDETGVANIIVWPKAFEKFRKIVLTSRLMGVRGKLQREGIVIHVIAEELVDLTPLLGRLSEDYIAMGETLSRADEVKRPAEDPRDITLHRLRMRQERAAKIMPKGRNFH